MAGDRVFTLEREGDHEQAVLVVRSATDAGEPPRLLIDPHLQATAAPARSEKEPVLLRIETRAGHGEGKPASKQADESADSCAFLAWQLGLDLS